MSIYKQLWLAIIGSMLLALGGALLASLLSARAYVQEQLLMKNTDNANALALSLSQQEPDLVLVELAVSALFDSGHYASIEVVDPEGNAVISRNAPETSPSAPRWFVALLPITAPAGEARITNGWTQIGTVALRSSSDFAYASLWRSALEMTLAVLLAGLVGGYLASRILQRIRQPLQRVVAQAEAITQRRLHTIDDPAVPELRQLSGAMNSMVSRLNHMFAEETRKLEIVRLAANTDSLTGLANRSHFLARLQDAIEGEDSSGGSLLLIRVLDLADINQRLGRNTTDELLRSMAAVLREKAQEQGEGLAGRLNGADFGLILPHGSVLQSVAEALLDALGRANATLPEEDIQFALGSTSFVHGQALGSVLAAADNALAAAEAARDNSLQEAPPEAQSPQRTALEWEETIKTALAGRQTSLACFPVRDFSGTLLHQECALRLQPGNGSDLLAARDFLPMAERLGLTAELDLAALQMGVDTLAADPQLPDTAINLHGDSLADPTFIERLDALLITHATSASRLWLEVSERGALRQLEAFKHFVIQAKRRGCKVGIEHMGRQFSQIGRFHALGIDYFKVDASFIRDLDSNPGNRSFMEGLKIMAKGVGVMVIAEGVTSDAELKTLGTLGFDGATGPLIR